LDIEVIENLGNHASNKITGVVYVSLNGRCGNITKLKKICESNDWFLLEDACQSFGSTHSNKYLGTIGDVGCFSLSPHKIITTGQGGFVVTNDSNAAEWIRLYKDFGRRAPGVDDHIHTGYNFKFTDLQAVVGLAQLESIDERINTKQRIYNRYMANLKGTKHIDTIPFKSGVPWFVDIYSEKREKIIEALKANRIKCRPMYPVVSTQSPYNTAAHARYTYSSEISAWMSSTGLWLPTYLELEDAQIDEICNVIKNAIN
jgi:perosamine synthetase